MGAHKWTGDERSYRACYYLSADGQSETVLTGPEHANLSDNQLFAEAIAEAVRADIIGDGDGRIPANRLEGGLRIGTWTVR